MVEELEVGKIYKYTSHDVDGWILIFRVIRDCDKVDSDGARYVRVEYLWKSSNVSLNAYDIFVKQNEYSLNGWIKNKCVEIKEEDLTLEMLT